MVSVVCGKILKILLLSVINALVPGSNPAFGTVVKTLDNLGFKLNIELKQVS